MKLRYLYIFILVVFIGCTKEMTLDTDFKSQIFIFGTLTDEPKNLVITIQESVPVRSVSTEPKPVKNAKITLYTKSPSGAVAVVTDNFIEQEENYISSQIIAPLLGNYYWIEVILEDGTAFKSIEEKLKNPIPITKITKANGFTRARFKDPVNEKNFYKLEVISAGNEYSFWHTQLSNDILFNGNDDAFIEVESFSGNNITAALLNFNYDTYQFYLNIAAQEDVIQEYDEEENSGDPSRLFAPPPVHLTGNISNTVTGKKALGNFGVTSISRKAMEFTSVFPEEINTLIYYTGNELSNTVIINTQGGPEPELATQEFNDILSKVNTTGILKVNVHQAQTINPQLFTSSEITFEQAMTYDSESIEILYTVIKYFKDQGRTVYVMGISFGAFMVEELIAKKGINVADKYLIMVGRLDMNDIYWKGFSQGQNGHYVNGVTPVLENQTGDSEKNMSKLAAGLGKNRYTETLDKYPDLSKVTYVYGKIDEAVGKLTQSEIDFLNDKNVTIIEGAGNHSQTIDNYIVEGFKVAFGVE